MTEADQDQAARGEGHFQITLSPSAGRVVDDSAKFDGYLVGDDPQSQEISIGPYQGNLYIFINGVEYGSLYFHTENGKPTVSLGQFDLVEQQWVDRNPLVIPAGGTDPARPIKVKLDGQVFAEFRTWSEAGKWLDEEDSAEDWVISVEPE